MAQDTARRPASIEEATQQATRDGGHTPSHPFPSGETEGERSHVIRERAYRIWLDEGQPDGRAEAHWELARELLAIEESYQQTLLPNPASKYEQYPNHEPIEEASLQENLGEFPTLTDQGEESTFPELSHTVSANTALSSSRRKKNNSRRDTN
jgi:hypothetical protein